MFSWFQYIPGYSQNMWHVWATGFVTLMICLLSLCAAAAAGTPQEALVPHRGPNLRNIFEVIVESLTNMTTGIIPHGEVYVPLIGSLFIYIFANNVSGMIPGFSPPTENFNTTFSIGVLTFFIYNFLGIKANGVGYIKHFLGPIWWLAPLMLIIELLSHLMRPLTLGLRLMNNMMGDHTILSIFLDLVPIGLPVVFYAFGLFVCFVQAFVFSLLSAVYISMATAHDH